VTQPAILQLQENVSKPLDEARQGPNQGSFSLLTFVFAVFPNRLQPKGDGQDLKGAMEAAERGRKTTASQIYKVINEMAEGHKVAMEVEWAGILAVPFGSIEAGAK
jgi:hypothetical protein